MASNNLQDFNGFDSEKLELTDELLNAVEYIPVEEDGPVKEREQTWIEGGEDEEPEENFLWIKECN
jgi:hypothetical protein